MKFHIYCIHVINISIVPHIMAMGEAGKCRCDRATKDGYGCSVHGMHAKCVNPMGILQYCDMPLVPPAVRGRRLSDASVITLSPIFLENISVQGYKARISDLEELFHLRDIEVRDLRLHLNSLGFIWGVPVVAGMLLLLSRCVRIMRVSLAGSM